MTISCLFVVLSHKGKAKNYRRPQKFYNRCDKVIIPTFTQRNINCNIVRKKVEILAFLWFLKNRCPARLLAGLFSTSLHKSFKIF
jgi:hypothetical protein